MDKPKQINILLSPDWLKSVEEAIGVSDPKASDIMHLLSLGLKYQMVKVPPIPKHGGRRKGAGRPKAKED